MTSKWCLLILGSILFLGVESLANGWIHKSNIGGVARHRANGFALGQKGYVGLGHYNGTGTNYAFDDWWEYDPASNSWTQKANYPILNYDAVCFTAQGKAYVIGGQLSTTTAFMWDPLTNAWTPMASPGSIMSGVGLSTPDKGYVLDNGQLYEYDPTTALWSLKSPPPGGTGTWQSGWVIGGSLYLKNGAQLSEYKISSDQWIVKAPFPGMAVGGAAAFTVQNKGYIVSGYWWGLGDLTGEAWEYDPGSDSWTMIEEFAGLNRRFSVSFNIGNTGYVSTGTNGTNFKDLWQFDYFLSVLDRDEELVSINTYPNPTTDYAMIELNDVPADMQLGDIELRLYDLTGRLAKQGRFESTILRTDLTDLSEGTYVYHIMYHGKSIRTGKIMKS